MFGAKPAGQFSTGTSLFGGGTTATTQQSLFGGASGGTGTFSFGGGATAQPQQTFGGFGTTSASNTGTTGGLFGSSPSSSLFNRPAGTQFGQTNAPSTSGSLFGGGGFGAAAGVPNGTTIKFVPLAGSDTMIKSNSLSKSGVSTNVATKHQCITAMKEYESKSVEELRMDDYLANRKAGSAIASGGLFGAQQPAATGLFGASANTPQSSTFGGGLFGNQAKPAGLFGGGATTSNSGGLFGNTAATSGSLFGAQSKPGGMFGATQPASQGTGLFGSTTTVAFGAAQPAAQGGLFGGAATGGFGTQASKPGGFGTFGAAATTATNSLFNFGTTTSTAAPATGGLFGNVAAQQQKPPLFGATGGFGTPAASTGGLFGAQQSTAGGGLFGANKPIGLGAPAAGTSLFGAQATQNTFGQTGSLFGGIGQQQNTSLFGGGATQPIGGLGLAQSVQPTSLTTDPNTANAQHAMMQQQILSMSMSPYGDNPLFRHSLLEKPKNEDILKPISSTAQKAFLSPSQFKVEKHKPVMKVKPRSVSARMNRLFEGLEEEDAKPKQYFVPRENPKKLVIKSSPPKPVLPLSMTLNMSSSSNFGATHDILAGSAESSYLYESQEGHLNGAKISQRPNNTSSNKCETTQTIGNFNIDDASPPRPDEKSKPVKVLQQRNSPQNISNERDKSADKTLLERSTTQANDDSKESALEIQLDNSDSLLKLRRPGYYTIPSQEELVSLFETTGELSVSDFCIGREGYGNVYFPGATNLDGLELDDIVHIRRKEVTIYPDDNTKPQYGYGLNKRAVITLEKVWPIDKTTHLPITSPEKLFAMGYPQKIERSTAKLSAKFVDYRPESGSWVFEVKHF